ncbi:DUF4267 domain-containing protein [Nocardia takedensis]|uniref:DUF4267 domain-containing protein n=1 Tax=Nocardia takedensis TaxID=259390 RepID=UPI003F774665
MLDHIADGLTGFIGVFALFISARALLVPRAAATSMGVPAISGLEPYMAIKAARDLGFALITFALLATATAHTLAWFMLAATIIPLIDGITVLTSTGSKSIAFGVHHSTAALMLLTAALLFITA